MNNIRVNQPSWHSYSELVDNSSGRGCFCGKIVSVIETVIGALQDFRRHVCNFLVKVKKIITRHCVVCCRDGSSPGPTVIRESSDNHGKAGICQHSTCVTDNHLSSVPLVSDTITITGSQSPEGQAEAVDVDSHSLTSQDASWSRVVAEPVPDSVSNQPWIRSDSVVLSKVTFHDSTNTHSLPTNVQGKGETDYSEAVCAMGHDLASASVAAASTIDTVDVTAVASMESSVSGQVPPDVSSDQASTVCLLPTDTEPAFSERFHELDRIITQKREVDPSLQKYEESSPLTFWRIVCMGDVEWVWQFITDYPEHFEQTTQGLLYHLFSKELGNRLKNECDQTDVKKLVLIVDNLLPKESDNVILDTLICIHALIKEFEILKPETETETETETEIETEIETDQYNQRVIDVLKECKIRITQYLARKNNVPNVRIIRPPGILQPFLYSWPRTDMNQFLSVVPTFLHQSGQIPVEADMLSRMLNTPSMLSKYQFLHNELIRCVYESLLHCQVCQYPMSVWISYLNMHHAVANKIVNHAMVLGDEKIISWLKQAGIYYCTSFGPLTEIKTATASDQPLLPDNTESCKRKTDSLAICNASRQSVDTDSTMSKKPDQTCHISAGKSVVDQAGNAFSQSIETEPENSSKYDAYDDNIKHADTAVDLSVHLAMPQADSAQSAISRKKKEVFSC